MANTARWNGETRESYQVRGCRRLSSRCRLSSSGDTAATAAAGIQAHACFGHPGVATKISRACRRRCYTGVWSLIQQSSRSFRSRRRRWASELEGVLPQRRIGGILGRCVACVHGNLPHGQLHFCFPKNLNFGFVRRVPELQLWCLQPWPDGVASSMTALGGGRMCKNISVHTHALQPSLCTAQLDLLIHLFTYTHTP